jgi:hypothetical protein
MHFEFEVRIGNNTMAWYLFPTISFKKNLYYRPNRYEICFLWIKWGVGIFIT